ncbi:MAG: hypothetical protein LBC18_03270 [Opitutaceae bacterium]|nr:hypothetical protein [Opitutaceae bacterium]
MPTKIESSLPPEQFLAFCAEAARLPGGTRLRVIQELAERHGISISPPAAAAFRDGPLADYLAELKAKRELAEQVGVVAQNGLALSDAAASVLTQKIFDQTLALDAGGDDALKKSGALSAALARLRAGDQRARALEATLKLRDEQLASLVLENDTKINALIDGLEKQAAAARGGKLTCAQIRAKIKEVYGA